MTERLDQQIAIYGSPLSERFAALRQYYGLSQRRLADVLGISAPMLSQLSTGARIKFGNPRVFERMLMLEELATQKAAPEAAVAQVEATSNATDTARATAQLRQATMHTVAPEAPGNTFEDIARTLARSLPAHEVRAALERSPDLPALRKLLTEVSAAQARQA